MNRKIITFILTSICLLFFARPSVAIVTEYRKAVDAYKKEDYKTSYNLIFPLAKQGFAQAQYNLGVMYGNGRGVAKDYSKAIKWWNLAADQGNDKAQYNLGVMYEKGKGVKKNLKTSKKWFQLASNQGLAKAKEKLNLLLNKIVIAMSGGVDSSVAAALLKQRGRDVVGISLQLWNYSIDSTERFGTCCSLDDLGDARRVADRVGIPFYILNMEKEFNEEVVDYFVSEYLKARTPIPCTLCNQRLKFDHLISRAEGFGYQRVATGHYALLVNDEATGRFAVKRGKDRSRDQSYFLFNLSQEQLSRLEFPLGDTDKKEVRRIAKELGLTVADKKESREICFVPDNDYASFIEKRVGEKNFHEGDIVNTDGEVLGRHRGYPAFTIGQRKGLNVGGLKEPHYVTVIDPEKNEITVGLKDSLYRSDFFVNKVNWYLPRQEVFETQVQIRYLHNGSTAKVKPLPGERAHVEFFEPQLSITPGQSAVFYVDDCIVGGGWIE